MEINNLENNIEIKSITKIGTEYNTKKFNFTQNNQKLYPKEDEIEIKRIKMKKFSSTNNNFKLSKDKIISNHNNIMHRQNTFNKLKNKKKEIQKQINKQIKGQKSTIITPNQNLVVNANSNIDNNENNNYYVSNSRKKEQKKITKNISRENMYINSSNINNTFNNFLLGGTQRKKILFKELENKPKNTKILKLYNINNNIYNDEITLINNTNSNDIYTTNYTTKNNKNGAKQEMMGSGNKIKKDKKIKYINNSKNNIENYLFNPPMKIDINNINNLESNTIINNNLKKIDIRSGEKKIENNKIKDNNLTGNNSKKNVVKNIKDIIIENSNKNNLNLYNSFKSEINMNKPFNTSESIKKDVKKKLNKNKILNLKISQRFSNYNEFNPDTNNLSCKNNKNKPKNKVIKLKDVNNNFNYVVNNGINFNSTSKNNNNKNIYITYMNNSSSTKNNNNSIRTNNICYNNLHINKSNSNLILNSNLSKEKINHRNSLKKLNTLQNEADVKKHLKHINYKSKINFSPPKIPFLKEKSTKKIHMNLKHPYSNKNQNKNEKINYSPKVNSIPKYVKTESSIANINIMNNNNIFINKLDFLENYAISSRKDNIFSKINNYILKGHNNKSNFINLLNKHKLNSRIENSRGNSLVNKKESKDKDKDKEINVSKKRLRKIDHNSDTLNINNKTNSNKNTIFNFGIKTTKNMYKKDNLLDKKYSFINILKPKTINKLKRYTHININKDDLKNEKRKDITKDNSKLLTNHNNKSLTFIYKEKKKNISSLLKQKNIVKLIQMMDDLNLNNSKEQSKSKKKNKSLQHINFMGSSSKKVINQENIKSIEDKNIIENVIKNNMTMYSIYILSKYENNFSKIGIAKIGLYDKDNKEIFTLYSNANINKENNEEENINYLFNENNRPFISEYKENLYINFYINIKKAYILKFIKILNYENKKEGISAVKEIKIYHGKKKLFSGILSINNENIFDISEDFKKNYNSDQIIPIFNLTKKRGNSASSSNNKTNIYNINYINYKKANINTNTRSYSTFRQNSGKKINKIPKKQIIKIKSERYLSPKQHLIKNSNIYNNTEINEDTYYDNNNNIFIYNICNTIPYNDYNENEIKEEKYKNDKYVSNNDLDQSNIHQGINLAKLNLNNNYYNNSSRLNSIYPEEKEDNFIKFKIIRLVLSSNYGHNSHIGLTGLEFYDINNKLINIETADTIGALPKDLHTIYNIENDNRIFENIFNGENNTDDSFNMWLTLFDKNKKENNQLNRSLPYIELSFNKIIYLSKIKFYNYNQINQLDKCLKTVDIFLDNNFFAKINLRQGLGIIPNENIIHKKIENPDDENGNNIKNDYSQDITFPLNNKYFEKIYENQNKYENNIYNEEKGLEDIDFASLKHEQCYETPFMPNGFILRFQLENNFHQGKNIENNNLLNNRITNSINNIPIRSNNYTGINILNIYDQNGNDLLSQKEIKYKIVSNKEIIILEENKYILYYTANDDNNNLYFLFETPVNISYMEIKPFSFSENDKNNFNSAKDIKIFCDTNIIFEGQLYQYHQTIILFTSDNKLLNKINTNYLTKYHLNREYVENKTEEYYSMVFT